MRFLLFVLVSFAYGDAGVTTHVLDVSVGLPGRGVEVTVYKQPVGEGSTWEELRKM